MSFIEWATLVDETKDSYLAYTKRKINPVYLDATIRKAILNQMKMISLEDDVES